MKKPIRLLSLLLCLVLVASCFAACGKETGDEQTETPTTEEATEPVVIELGAVIDKVYTIVEIDRTKRTCLALLLEDENSYKNGTYTQGREYDIITHELVSEVRYTRDSKNRLTKVVYSDPKTNDTIQTEEYSYTPDGRPLSSVSRDAQGITINSVAYTYNTNGTYDVATSENGRIASIATCDSTDKVITRIDYEYKDDGSYSIRHYADGKLIQLTEFAADGTESNRAVYTYNPDGTFSVSQYENGILKNEQTGTADQVITQPAETTTEEKETLDTNADITVPTEPPATRPNENTTNKNDTTTRPNTTTTTTTTQPATDSSGNIDMLAQSRVFRSGEYYMTGLISDGGEMSKMILAVTPKTMYASVELDFGAMMGGLSTGVSEFGFLKASDGKYYLLDASKEICCEMDEATLTMIGGTDANGETMSPEELFGDLSLSDAFIQVSESAKPDRTENAMVDGNMVTCYTFNIATGESVKHYVDDNGSLVRVEEYSANGLIINSVDIENLSDNVQDHMKKVPKNYTKMGLFDFMLELMGESGETIA